MNEVDSIQTIDFPDDDDTLQGLETAITLLKFYMEDQEKSMVLLRDIAKTFLATGSILISLISGLRLAFEFESNHPILFDIAYISLGILYIGFVVFCLLSMKPESWHLPFKQDLELLKKALCVPEVNRKEGIITAYLKTLDSNRTIIVRRTNYVIWSGILLGLSVICILLISFIPKIPV